MGTLPTRLLALDYGADIVYTEELIDWATHIYVMQEDMRDAIRGISPDALVRTKLLGALDPDAADPQIPDVGGDSSPEASVALRFARIDHLLRCLMAQELAL